MCVSMRPAPAWIFDARFARSRTTGLATAETSRVTYCPMLSVVYGRRASDDVSRSPDETGETG